MGYHIFLTMVLRARAFRGAPLKSLSSKVMQNLDCVFGLHNCLEFSQPPLCLDQAMQKRKKPSIT